MKNDSLIYQSVISFFLCQKNYFSVKSFNLTIYISTFYIIKEVAKVVVNKATLIMETGAITEVVTEVVTEAVTEAVMEAEVVA